MQMIKNREESILRFYSRCEVMYIINYQYIYQLIEIYKIINLIISRMLNKLMNKFFGTYIQNSFIWMKTFCFVAYGMY